ncbi:hypothetical protein GCM10027598_58200 [Amycolatopsis oliviviridis]|uniref:Uncharacterized protein n=1 Tax=Amycolatopsis oliviviridis TaxID=1471590 RepID=A0ABQ3LYY1_9PSEU|nr:hypothetical protein [Amycolatopsis oliviviridis]GHH28278.1 hypothetical protein GCM10017790_58850 [Amycolatopsis oliviviridis]
MSDNSSFLSFRFPAPPVPARTGLEPAWLHLPMPETSFADCPGCGEISRSDTEDASIAGSWSGTPAVAEEEATAWGRWMLGHHLSFCAWRLLHESLSRAVTTEIARSREDRRIAELFDTYSALLLYAGSCTPKVYETVIRVRMAEAHPGFSGLWYRDNARIQELSARLTQRFGFGVEAKAAMRFNRLAHASLANRLVPEGPSLRRESGHAQSAISESERDTADDFFRTRRKDLCRHEFVAQLISRTTVALTDLARHPLTARYGHESVDRFQDTVCRRLERFALIALEEDHGAGQTNPADSASRRLHQRAG